MYYDFVSNVMAILFLCGVVTLMDLSLNKKYSRYILGVMFGLITIFIMNDKFMVDNGHDFRHISIEVDFRTKSGEISIKSQLIDRLMNDTREFCGSSGTIEMHHAG